MRLEQLEYFLDVSKTKSLNASAERLFVTQPTISEAIHKLEEELGSTLLTRSSKGVELSETGHIVQGWAQIILDNIDQMKEDIWRAKDNYNPGLQGDLCIGATNIADNYIVPRILDNFMKFYTNVNMRFFTIRHYEVSLFLNQGIIDLALFNWFEQELIETAPSEEYKSIFDDDRLQHIMLGSEDLQVVAHRNLPISKKKEVCLEELIKYPLILHISDIKTEKEIMRFLKNVGDCNVVLYADNVKVLRRAVLDERGVGLFAKSAFGNVWFEDVADNEVLRIIHLKEKLHMRYYLAYVKGKKLTMAEKALIQQSMESCHDCLEK